MFQNSNLTREKFAFISFLFGVLTVFGVLVASYGAWTLWELFPFLSFSFAIIFGILGLKSKRKVLAISGIVLAVLTFLFLFVISL